MLLTLSFAFFYQYYLILRVSPFCWQRGTLAVEFCPMLISYHQRRMLKWWNKAMDRISYFFTFQCWDFTGKQKLFQRVTLCWGVRLHALQNNTNSWSILTNTGHNQQYISQRYESNNTASSRHLPRQTSPCRPGVLRWSDLSQVVKTYYKRQTKILISFFSLTRLDRSKPLPSPYKKRQHHPEERNPDHHLYVSM